MSDAANVPAGTDPAAPPAPPADAAPASPANPPADPAAPDAKPADPAVPDAKPDEQKPADVTYTLTLPESAAVDAGAIERTAATARELGLSNDAAQKMLELANGEVKAATTALLASLQPGGAEWQKQDAAWKAAALADAEIGGTPEKLAASTAYAQRALDRFAPDEESRKFLDDSGIGSHPAALKILARIGKAMGEAPIATPDSPPSGEPTARERLDAMYPSMKKTT